ncbi:hypothetical protein HanRHA438_Chr01g0006111 [Helianthus annuus]|nr:hypothetical protein HanRHA438_Chr01g0006111 [Helianthus annuus]
MIWVPVSSHSVELEAVTQMTCSWKHIYCTLNKSRACKVKLMGLYPKVCKSNIEIHNSDFH